MSIFPITKYSYIGNFVTNSLVLRERQPIKNNYQIMRSFNVLQTQSLKHVLMR